MILNHNLAQIITSQLIKDISTDFYNKHLLHELQHRTKATNHTYNFMNHMITFYYEWTVHIKPYPGLYVTAVVYTTVTYPINYSRHIFPRKV